jgi:hypothetical protein
MGPVEGLPEGAPWVVTTPPVCTSVSVVDLFDPRTHLFKRFALCSQFDLGNCDQFCVSANVRHQVDRCSRTSMILLSSSASILFFMIRSYHKS